MNELLLQQLLDKQPRFSHSTITHVRELEPLYLACLYIDPSISDIEIDDSSTTGDVFDLLSAELEKNGVSIDHEKGKEGTEIKYTYEIETTSRVIELHNLLKLKKTNETKYNILLNCIFLLSRYCENLFEHHQMIKDNIDDDISMGEEDYSEYKNHIECKKIINSHNDLEHDYFKIKIIGYEKILSELNAINSVRSENNLNDEKTIELTKIIGDNFAAWTQFDEAGNDYNDNENSINFTMYNCFVLTLENEYYTDWLDSHYQYYWENGCVNNKFTFINNGIKKLQNLVIAYTSFIDAITIVNDIIRES